MSALRCKQSLLSAISALLLVYALSLAVATSSFAACTNDRDAAQRASNFVNNPSSLLAGPNGPRSSDDIANDVQNFVAANPQALPVVITLLKDLVKDGTKTSDPTKAIGTGLGKASNICKAPDLGFATEIQTQLAGAGSSDANAQYAAITGNDPTRSVAAGGLGSGSVGGQTTPVNGPSGGSSSLQTFSVNSVSNNPTNYSTSAGPAAPAAQRQPSSALFRTLASKT
jgi:hypothetical protein